MAVLVSAGTVACTNLIVTKGASKDGSVMVTYSADSHQLYGELYLAGCHMGRGNHAENLRVTAAGMGEIQAPLLIL